MRPVDRGTAQDADGSHDIVMRGITLKMQPNRNPFVDWNLVLKVKLVVSIDLATYDFAEGGSAFGTRNEWFLIKKTAINAPMELNTRSIALL